nr:uncharacterized protein LOC111425171 [Onthophagus taurus]
MDEFENKSAGNYSRQEQKGFTSPNMGDNYAGVFITNARSVSTLCIRNMMSSYGTVMRIMEARLEFDVFNYLVIYETAEEAENAMVGVTINRPAFALNFEFELMPHSKLIDHHNIFNYPNICGLKVTDYY